MGGCSSKPAVDDEKPEDALKPTDTEKSDVPPGNPNVGQNVTPAPSNVPASAPPKAAPQSTGTKAVAKSPPAQTSKQQNGTVKSSDPNWAALWKAHHNLLLDPADIHSTMGDLMARATNKLSPSEITLIQRKVRKVIRKFNDEGAKKKGLLTKSSSSNALDAESRVIAERNHLLSNQVIQQVLPTITAAEDSSVDPFKAIYLLLQYSHESLWDRVENIAVESANAAGFNMDVNYLQPPSECPTVYRKSQKAPEELPLGISLQSLTSVMGLALRGSRAQKLQLLFYLLLSPKVLSDFLAQHPGGGVPTWLLEVGNDVVLSLGSLAHYYHYGDAFTPGTKGNYHPDKADSPLKLNGKDVDGFLKSILSPPSGGSNGESPDVSNTKTQPVKKSSSLGLRRRKSDQSIDSTVDVFDLTQTEVMDRLQEDKEFAVSDYVLNESASQKKFLATPISDGDVDMKEFHHWAQNSLDDSLLDAIMQRMFSHGLLPSPGLEMDLVLSRWREWQETDCLTWSKTMRTEEGTLDVLTQSVRKILAIEEEKLGGDGEEIKKNFRKTFGGIAGFDGRGGCGLGVMYCVDKQWWDSWEAYVDWTWAGQGTATKQSGKRPKELSQEKLLNRDDDNFGLGILGSYELMKEGLIRDQDYVLVPPGVWDILYEIYGGGPGLPRMVVTPKKDEGGLRSYLPGIASGSNASTEINLDTINDGVIRPPSMMQVETHPWVLHFHLCDPQQPYRRGDTGPMTIRVMSMPDQPLWRLYAEIAVRLPFSSFKVYDSSGRGQARLWKRIEPKGPKDVMSRYGPWTLLCKDRCAILPSQNEKEELEEHYEELKKNWEEYCDNATVQSMGLVDGDQLMVECATITRSGKFMWPREVAAKAGQVRRLADQDMKFRRMLRGLDENGKPLEKPPELVGMVVDAMDSSGRWYQVKIIQVQIVDDTDEDSTHSDYSGEYDGRKEGGEHKELLLDFSEHGGHSEWIDNGSDRLATAGRFTLGNEDDTPDAQKKNSNGANGDKGKTPQVKKAAPDGAENGKSCTLPGYGACGLVNLGNTCYANSAIQCMSYLPLLRAYLLSSQYKSTGDLNKDNPLGTGGKLLEEFAELLRTMWGAKLGEKSPSRFKSQLGKANMQFAGADQQDAQEFLNFMLDALHEDTNRVRKKPYVEGLEDEWVIKNSLHRVGEEAWRRFLRRNRSVMADIAMGQVLNTVTCPVCSYSSRNFDPFNLLSIPFPEVADVIFKVYLVRRANVFNTPWVLNKPKKGSRSRARFPFRDPGGHKPPSDHLVGEEYIIAMSRLADSGDLKLQIQNLCGVPATHLRLCKAEEISMKDKEHSSVVTSQIQVTLLTDKEGPCSQFVKQRPDGDVSGMPDPSLIVAFESTLRPRPFPRPKSGDESESDENVSHGSVMSMDKMDLKEMEMHIAKYGNHEECRLYDTVPTQIAKGISRSLWPRTEVDFKLGLRVDAIDHRQHWFPGSVVEILEPNGAKEESKDQDGAKTKVRIHFDNFSSKWDEMYTIDHFIEGRVRPLYSHAVPKSKPTEFIAHHRYMDRSKRLSNLFGQTFFVQCHNEWSTARAGAQILAQASRFLRLPPDFTGPVDVDDNSGDRETKVQRLYDRTQAVISDLIDLLIDCDRDYIQQSMGLAPNGEADPNAKGDKYRNPSFDASALSASLVKRVNTLLHRLPFEVRVCTADSPLGGTNEEVAFPFSLMRTIGNYMNSRHAVVLQWREPPSDKKAPGGNGNYLGAPVMYVSPKIAVHEKSAEILEKAKEQARKAKAQGTGGLKLGVCLSEYCKIQTLSLNDNWRCPQCREFREGKQSLELWRLPDILTIHIKRFNCSARWREKITTKINFPLNGLDMSEWCHKESHATMQSDSHESTVYDCIGVMNHYGGMTGGHYVATCKATACGRDGREEVAYNFNGVGAGKAIDSEEDQDGSTGWRLGRQKSEVNFNKVAAASTARAAQEASEPLWLQFDDEMVEPIAPRHVVTETAYVLFYRRRQMTPANIARYSTLE